MKKNEYQQARRFGRQKLKVKIIDFGHEPHWNINTAPKNKRFQDDISPILARIEGLNAN
jgi:hypothetical protein